MFKSLIMTKREFIISGLLVVFVIVSVIFIMPSKYEIKSQYSSSDLDKSITEEDNTTVISFINQNGQVSFAADLGYATKVIRVTFDGNIRTESEQYFDEKGIIVPTIEGYYWLQREYNDNNTVCISYFSESMEPMVISQGYSTEIREYNTNNQIIAIKYYDAKENPVLTKTNGYGRRYSYNEKGQVSSLTYLNSDGSPMVTGSGYASVKRLYYSTNDNSNGRIEYEFYFDENDNPISLSLGQFGIHREYDEDKHATITTYLDSSKRPMVTKQGYTSVERTFYPNNSVKTEKYFDFSGHPFALSEGQYGIKRENAKTIYLDAEGNELFNMKQLLYNCPVIVIIVAIASLFISLFGPKRLIGVLFVCYIGVIAYFTLMFRAASSQSISLRPFWSYLRILSDATIRANIIENVWLFFPLGGFLKRIYPKAIILLVPLFLSVAIETIQLVLGIGLCEIDDVVNNCIGAIFGFIAEGYLLKSIKRQTRK